MYEDTSQRGEETQAQESTCNQPIQVQHKDKSENVHIGRFHCSRREKRSARECKRKGHPVSTKYMYTITPQSIPLYRRNGRISRTTPIPNQETANPHCEKIITQGWVCTSKGRYSYERKHLKISKDIHDQRPQAGIWFPR